MSDPGIGEAKAASPTSARSARCRVAGSCRRATVRPPVWTQTVASPSCARGAVTVARISSTVDVDAPGGRRRRPRGRGLVDGGDPRPSHRADGVGDGVTGRADPSGAIATRRWWTWSRSCRVTVEPPWPPSRSGPSEVGQLASRDAGSARRQRQRGDRHGRPDRRRRGRPAVEVVVEEAVVRSPARCAGWSTIASSRSRLVVTPCATVPRIEPDQPVDRGRRGRGRGRSACRASGRSGGVTSPPASTPTSAPQPRARRAASSAREPSDLGQLRDRVLGVPAHLDGVPVGAHVVLVDPQRLAGGDPQLQRDEVEAGDELGDRVLDLQAGVHLEEEEGRFGVVEGGAVEQELDRPGALVADGRGPRRRPRRRAAARSAASTAGEGASSTTFWWRRWTEHSRSSRWTTLPVRVAEDLHLDVTGARAPAVRG